MSNLDFSKALEFFQRAYSIYKEIGNKYGMSAVLCNIGSIYQKIYSYNKALKYLNKALVMDEELGINGGVAINNIWIGHIYADRNTELYNPKKAADHYLKAIFINETIGAKQNLYSTHQHLSALYKQEKRWEEYAEHIEKYHELYIEVQSEEVKKQADRFGWQRKIAEMEKQKEIDLLKTEAEKLNMQQKIEFQAREVENTIHELIKKNNLLQQVQSGILKIKPHTKGEAIAHIEQLLDRVSRNITPHESISELDKQWTEVHKDFMNKLKGSFPDLTAMKLKIAALLTMKLTSSNIASVLFLSKRTVESHRHSLRKKMGISVADDIYTVLTTYSH